MSNAEYYTDVDEIREYATTVMQALLALQNLPTPNTRQKLDSTTLWGVQRGLDESIRNLELLHQSMIDAELETEHRE